MYHVKNLAMSKIKLSYYKYIIDNSFNSLVLITLLMINITSIFQFFSTNFFENFLSYNSNLITVLPLLLICLINTIHIVMMFDKNYMFFSRLKNNNEYYNNLIYNIYISNSCILLFNLISSLITIFIFSHSNLGIPLNVNGVNYVIICIYYFFKSFIIYLLLSILGAFIFKEGKIYGFICYLIILIALLFGAGNTFSSIGSISDMPVNIFDYMKLNTYPSFFHDIIFFMLYCGGIVIIIKVLKILSCKRKSDYLL